MGCMTKFVPAEHKISLIHITSYQEKNFEGILQNAYYTERKRFNNLTQLLFVIDQLQDDLQYPQKGMETRTFKGDTAVPFQLPELQVPPGETMATFKLHLLFRQNASWQGSVIWMEEGVEAQFRSALELVSLMDSVLD